MITGAIFFLLMPTTQIYTSWFPDKKAQLWLLPAGVLLISSLLWMAASLSTPFLIRCGIFEDRRRGDRQGNAESRVRVFKSILPVISFAFHMLLLIGICISMVLWTKHRSSGEIENEVNWNYVPR